MQKHTRIYLKVMGFTIADFIPCEVCGAKSVDIHHIERRGMGGNKDSDNISNLVALCRECHIKYGDKKQYKQMLIEKHNKYLYN